MISVETGDIFSAGCLFCFSKGDHISVQLAALQVVSTYKILNGVFLLLRHAAVKRPKRSRWHSQYIYICDCGLLWPNLIFPRICVFQSFLCHTIFDAPSLTPCKPFPILRSSSRGTGSPRSVQRRFRTLTLRSFFEAPLLPRDLFLFSCRLCLKHKKMALGGS